MTRAPCWTPRMGQAESCPVGGGANPRRDARHQAVAHGALDAALLDWLALRIVVANTGDPVSASVTRSPSGTLVQAARSGTRFDAGAVRDAIATALASSSGDVSVAISLTPIAPAI